MWLTADESEALRLSLSYRDAERRVQFTRRHPHRWVLTRVRFVGRTLLDALVHLPLVLPPVVVGYILLLLFGTRGFIGSWLQKGFGIVLVFTSNGAALATAVMSFR